MTDQTTRDNETPVDMAKLKMSCESILLKSIGRDFDDISTDELAIAIQICEILRKHDVSHYRARTILRYAEIVLSTTKISIDNSPRLKPEDSRFNDHCLQEQV